MERYIKTVGDLRRALGAISDDQPIEFWLNDVQTQAYFMGSGADGGDIANIVVEANYTCKN